MSSSDTTGLSRRGGSDSLADDWEQRNANTICAPGYRDLATELDEALAAKSAQLAAYFTGELAPDADVAARVALIAGGALALHALPAAPEAFLVVGRHSEASLRGADAASLSLRHVLLIPQRAGEGSRVLLDVVALAPTMRLAPWLRPLPAELAGRCSALQLGDALLLVAPAARTDGTTELCLAPEPAAQLAAPRRVPKTRATFAGNHAGEWTRISSAAPIAVVADQDDLAAVPGYVLELRSGDQQVRVSLREPWLATGIVLGRDEGKCSHASLARLLGSNEVSRCHLYLRRERDEIVFYDTASTWGVRLSEDEEAAAVHRFALRAASPAPGTALAVEPAGAWLWLTPDVRVGVSVG